VKNAKIPNIAIIGTGNVGSTTAAFLAEKGLGNLFLIDKNKDKTKAIALDLVHSIPIENRDIIVEAMTSYKKIKDMDIIIITAGMPRKKGMDRKDLITVNSKIIKEISKNIKHYCKKKTPIIIVVTNPLEAMHYLTYKITKFDRHKIIGMGPSLDSSRLKSFIALEAKKSSKNIKTKDIKAMVIGCHNCNVMLILKEKAKIKGKPLKRFISKNKIKEIVERTKNAGSEIVSYLKQGSAYFAPAKAIVEIVDSIVNDKKKIIPCTVICKAEYNLKDIPIGLPCVIGKKGIEKIIQIKLSEKEKKEMRKSIVYVKDLIKLIKKTKNGK